MNQNEWNEWNGDESSNRSENQANERPEYFEAERTPYTTPQGGSGVHYHSRRREDAWSGNEQSESAARRRAGRGAAWSAVLIVALCIALGFSTGIFGSKIYNYLQQGQEDPYENFEGDTQTPTKFPTATEGMAQNSPHASQTSEQDRNPTPDLDKSNSLGQLTWSGSAGKDAYSTMTQAIAAVADTVVEISTETMVSGGWLGNYVSSGAGSGVVISSDGYIVTNNHVIDGADNINVRMSDGTVYAAMLIGRDFASDIAVLWIDTQDQELQAAQMGCSADLIVGETVFAIGNPLGSLGGTVTDGIISATARSITISGQNMTLLQTNAAVNPGNSGGGLFNMAGQLIGVVNAKCSQDDVEGLGFAIPVDTAYDVIDQLIKYGYVRGVVDAGLSLYDITSSNIMTAWRYFNSTNVGVYVVESAHTDEVKYGDLLYAIDGVQVRSSEEVEALLSTYEIGDTVELTLIRAEKEYTVSLTLQEYVPSDLNVQFNQNN